MGKPQLLGLDPPRVSRDMALELMVHHLELAAMYYEATPQDHEATKAEAERLILEKEVADHVPPSLVALRSWLEAIRQEYEDMKKRDYT